MAAVVGLALLAAGSLGKEEDRGEQGLLAAAQQQQGLLAAAQQQQGQASS